MVLLFSCLSSFWIGQGNDIEGDRALDYAFLAPEVFKTTENNDECRQLINKSDSSPPFCTACRLLQKFALQPGCQFPSMLHARTATWSHHSAWPVATRIQPTRFVLHTRLRLFLFIWSVSPTKRQWMAVATNAESNSWSSCA